LSQNTVDLNDSLYNLKLRLFINDYEYLDSAYPSALREIRLSDSALTVQAGTILDLKALSARKDDIISALRQRISEIEGSNIPWYIYTTGGGLVFIIGILTGIIVK
jgi:hypothetical protein